MAQAPDFAGGGGAPRQNKTVKEFSGMNTQNERNAIPPGAFHWLENIQPIGPGHLHSIPGRSTSVVRIPPTPIPPPPEVCNDQTERGQGQGFLSIVTAFDQDSTFVAGNMRTTWGYIHNGDFNSAIGNALCGGGNVPYVDACAQINHYTGDNPTVASFNGPPIQDANCRLSTTHIGNSNVNVWRTNRPDNAGDRFWFDNGNSFVDCAPLPTSNFGGIARTNFAIDDTEIWVFCGPFLDGGPPNVTWFVCDRTSGLELHRFNSFGNDVVNLSNYMLTENHLYAVGTDAGNNWIWKIDRSDGTIVGSPLQITNLAITFIAVADDNLIYLLGAGDPARVYYLKNFSEIIYIGRTSAGGFSGVAGGTAIWDTGQLYWGFNGFGGFSTDVKKIAIDCPPSAGPIIASLTTDPTVAAGANLAVNWFDVLVPATDDTIVIKPEPAANVYGLAGATIASFTNSSALSDGSTSITIPGGTTPGNYVAMYAATGSIWVATSPVFTVT